jgi:N-methylhydantoinase A/acetophenone carboxylase
MDVVHWYESAESITLKSATSGFLSCLDDFNGVILHLEDTAFRDMRGEGFDPDKIAFELEMEIVTPEGYHLLQSPKLLLESEEDIKVICDAYTNQFASAVDEDLIVQLFRLNASAPVAHYQFSSQNHTGQNPDKSFKSERKVYWQDGFTETNIYEHNLLQSGNVVIGPAVIESEDTTLLVPLGQKYTVDKFLNGSMETA